MDEFDLKCEFAVDETILCRTCLAVDRKMVPLGKYSNIFQQLVTEFKLHDEQDVEDLLICWECYALLHKTALFQRKVERAREILLLGDNNIHGTLSNLTTVILNDMYQHTIYFDKQPQITNEMKTEQYFEEDYQDSESLIEDNIGNTTPEDNVTSVNMKTDKPSKKIHKVTKHGNKWAKKKALENKKPKFKILSNKKLKHLFKTVNMDLEELEKYLTSKRDSKWFNTKKYKCESCVIGFKNENSLLKHNRRLHSKDLGTNSCDICSSYFQDKRHLAAHIKKHFYKYACTVCQYLCFKSKDRMKHAQEHGKIFQCLKCGLNFGCRREFFKHYKDWHEKYICDYCGISFKMRYCIKDHIRKQHSPFICTPCNKRFTRYSGLWIHKKTCHSVELSSAYCVECDKWYADVYRYRWHLANSVRHRPKNQMRIPCPGCDKVFSKNIYMKDHYNLVHLKNYKYRCENCDKNFSRNADLVKHKRRVHEGISPPKNKICYLCGRGFSTNKILSNHVRTHTGERPFACEQCAARFAQSAALNKHVRAVHNADTKRSLEDFTNIQEKI